MPYFKHRMFIVRKQWLNVFNIKYQPVIVRTVSFLPFFPCSNTYPFYSVQVTDAMTA